MLKPSHEGVAAAAKAAIEPTCVLTAESPAFVDDSSYGLLRNRGGLFVQKKKEHIQPL